jgi:hypothetical protein
MHAYLVGGVNKSTRFQQLVNDVIVAPRSGLVEGGLARLHRHPTWGEGLTCFAPSINVYKAERKEGMSHAIMYGAKVEHTSCGWLP